MRCRIASSPYPLGDYLGKCLSRVPAREDVKNDAQITP